MRLLAVGSAFPPDGGTSGLIWASAMELLRNRGHDVAVLTAASPDALERALDDVRPDAVVWWSMAGMPLALIEQVGATRTPAVAAVCEDWFGDVPEGRAHDVFLPVASWVFLSAHLRSRAFKAGLRLKAVPVAHRGADPSFRAAAEGEVPTVAGKPWSWRLLYRGGPGERDGIDLASAALAELPDEARLTVADGDAGDLPALVASMDVLVSPVRSAEPWDVAPLEAMAAGTLVVASGRGGSGEYLREGRNCLLADPDEGPGALAAAVRELAGDAELRERLRGGGLATADSIDPRGFETVVAEELERVGANSGP